MANGTVKVENGSAPAVGYNSASVADVKSAVASFDSDDIRPDHPNRAKTPPYTVAISQEGNSLRPPFKFRLSVLEEFIKRRTVID